MCKVCRHYTDCIDPLCRLILDHEKTAAQGRVKLTKAYSREASCLHEDIKSIRISGRYPHLWRAVDQDGDVLDILVQKAP